VNVERYTGMLFGLCFTFGIVFELPILVLILTVIGIATPQFLVKYRRHAFVICLIAAALITPGQDPLTLGLVTLPLYVLYELSIFFSFIHKKRRKKREAPKPRKTPQDATN